MTLICSRLSQDRTEMDRLEALVDKHGIPAILDAVAEIASMKADHIRENWQDERLARKWDRACIATMKASYRVFALSA